MRAMASEIWPSIGPIRETRPRRRTAVDERTSTSKDRRPEGAAGMLGKGGALLGIAAACLLTAGGVGAALAVSPGAQAAPAPPPPTTHAVTVLDAPTPPEA